jgi:hypothetical protein
MSVAIALEDKSHQAVTEAADAVVEKDRIGGIWHAQTQGLKARFVPAPILSPFQGHVTYPISARLAPWAAIFRRYAAGPRW